MADAPRKPAIVVVDDEPEVLRAIARDVRRRYGDDYRVIRTSSGEEAVDAVRQLAERGDAIALVLSDQRMPGIGGVETLKRIQEHAPRAKRAMLTAYADTDAAIGAINDGRADYYLLKPWDPPDDKLYPVLDDLLEDWRAGYRPGFGGLRLISDRWSADGHRLRDFLSRNQIPYTFLDVERDEEAQRLAEAATLPLVLTPDGERMENPSNSKLAATVGLQQTAQREFYDLAIIGGGPAGLASAVYGASEGLKTVLVEREAPGGQAGTSSRIENYLGFPSGLSGADLARRGVSQAKRFGVEILAPVEVQAVRVDGPYKILETAGGEIACHALMLSLGVDWRKLPSDGADRLEGKGVYYGAAMTEALACTGEHVFVVGAGNSAGQAALHFADYAAKVTILVRGDDLAKSMSQYLVDRIENHEVIEVLLQHEVSECEGEDRLECVTVKNRQTGETQTVDTHYLFVFIGATPHTGWLGELVARDEKGFVRTGPDLREEDLNGWPLERDPFLLETSAPGVFVAGDVRSDSVKRVASAVGEGSVAVAFVHRHLSAL
ncbi:MAG: FAD-dependent oxidoreductase [Bacteroidota bacterium]